MAIVNITTQTDADFLCNFLYTYQSGTAIDLTGDTMRMGIRKRASDITEQMMLTTENGGLTITNAVGGGFSVYITQADLERLPVDSYEHSLVRFHAGNILRVWSGTLINNAGASR
jgi:hypothetical protein